MFWFGPLSSPGGVYLTERRCNWQSLKAKRGAELEGHYIELLRVLGTWPGMLGQIFAKAQNKIQDPAKLFPFCDSKAARCLAWTGAQ